MILQCTECKARYLVPDQAIGTTGRTVRCANCSHTWFQELPAPAAAEQESLGELDKMLEAINARAEAPVEPTPIPKGSNLPVVRRSKASLGIKAALVVTAAIAAGLVVMLVHPSLLGFSPSTGIALADPGAVRLMIDNKVMYNINGKIVNTTDTPRKSPNVCITLMDDDGVAARAPWNINLTGQVIPPGKAVPFTTGNIEMPANSKATRFVVDLGNPIELALRKKPD